MKHLNMGLITLLAVTLLIASYLKINGLNVVVLDSKENSAEIKVVVTTRPLHSVVSFITEGVTEPELLYDHPMSPHDIKTTPSMLKKINSADLVVWAGTSIETNLSNKLVGKANQLSAENMPDVYLLNTRNTKGETLRNYTDGHFWLSPSATLTYAENVKQRLLEIEKSEGNKNKLEENFALFSTMMKELITSTRESLKEANVSYITMHDSLHYFEKEFGLSAPLILMNANSLSAGALSYRQAFNENNKKPVKCVIYDKPSNLRAATIVAENTSTLPVFLDVNATTYKTGKTLYKNYLQDLSQVLASCTKE